MKYSRHLIAFLIALLFSWLFFERSAGINIFIFDTSLLAAIFFLQKEKLKSNSVRLFLFGVFSSSLFVVLHNSAWSIFIHHFSVFLLGGALAASHLKSVVSIMVASFVNAVLSIREYVTTRVPRTEAKHPAFRVLNVLRISAIPIIVIAIFGTLYANASPWFNRFWSELQHFFYNIFGDLLDIISFTWFFTFVLGMLITVFLLFAKSTQSVDTIEDDQPDELANSTYPNESADFLKRERQIAILLFASLNLMLFGQNTLDLTHVWFGFNWNGAYLKQFVHEGTWLLIISIILSAVLLLYYFRGHQNFLENNKVLRILAYVFIGQNMLLAASVAVRNIWYIDYFNLAFKRIGVFFFLAAVIYGLFSIYQKVAAQKTIYYLMRKNSVVVYLLLLFISFANWDNIIARYNFAHADKAYVHLNFLEKLNDSALPYLNQPIDKLREVKQEQDASYGRDKYALSPEDYTANINSRIERFLEKYHERDWLEWNYADWHAYKLLESR